MNPWAMLACFVAGLAACDVVRAAAGPFAGWMLLIAVAVLGALATLATMRSDRRRARRRPQ